MVMSLQKQVKEDNTMLMFSHWLLTQITSESCATLYENFVGKKGFDALIVRLNRWGEYEINSIRRSIGIGVRDVGRVLRT
jgi:hypothetical protein